MLGSMFSYLYANVSGWPKCAGAWPLKPDQLKGGSCECCPGRKPPFWVVKRPARPHKKRYTKPFSYEKRYERLTALGGPDRGAVHCEALPLAAARPGVITPRHPGGPKVDNFH